MFYVRRDPGGSQVAEVDGKVVGFMLGDCRAGEFGLEEPERLDRALRASTPTTAAATWAARMFDAMCAHFRAEGATSVRTLVDRERHRGRRIPQRRSASATRRSPRSRCGSPRESEEKWR